MDVYMNCKTTQESRSLHSDLESFHVPQPSYGLWLGLGLGLGWKIAWKFSARMVTYSRLFVVFELSMYV